MKKILFLLLFLCGNAWGTITTIGDSDFPYVVSTGAGADDTIRIIENVTWSGSGAGLTVPALADSCTIDIGTFTYTFGSNTDTNTIQGITVQADHIKIIGSGTIQIGWDYNHYAWRTRCIWGDNTQYFDVSEVTVIHGGYAGLSVDDYSEGNHGVYLSGSNRFMNRIHHLTIETKSSGFYWRQYYPITGIILARGSLNNSLVTDPETEYHDRIDSNTLVNMMHTGIFAYGSEGTTIGTYIGMFHIFDNNVKMQIRGVEDWSGSGFRYGDAYGITTRNVNGLWVRGNTVWSDTTSIVDVNGDTIFGGQGIFIDGASPSSYDGWFNKVDSNFIYPSAGDQGGGHSTGIHTRHMSHLYIRGNIIRVASDSEGNGNSTPWRSGESNCMWIGFNTNEDMAQDSIFISGNELHADLLSGGSNSYNFRFRGKGEQWYWETRGNDLNVINSGSGQAANYLYMGDDSANAINSYSDSVTRTGDVFTYGWYPYNLWSGLLEKNYDLRFEDDTGADTSIFTGGGGNKELSLYKSIQLTVNDSNSQPIANAVCSLFLSNDTSVGTTNANGIYQDTLNYYYFTNSIEEQYDPIIIKVVASGELDSTVVSDYPLANISGNRDTTITLSATEGSGSTNTKKLQSGYFRKGKL